MYIPVAACSRLSSNVCNAFKITIQRKYSLNPWMHAHMRDLWNRRQIFGEDTMLHPRRYPNWNYDVELAAFRGRVTEFGTLSEARLHQVFTPTKTHFVEAELPKSRTVQILLEEEPAAESVENIDESEQGSSNAMEDVDGHHTIATSSEVGTYAPDTNQELVFRGEEFMNMYATAYLRYHLPDFPEEGIEATRQYLMQTVRLATIGKLLGMDELVKNVEEYPLKPEIVADTFKALIGALSKDQGKDRARTVVQDFLMTQLHGVDLCEVFYVMNPVGILRAVCNHKQMDAPVSRVIKQVGVKTVMPTIVIGMYSGHTLLGQDAGETYTIAEEMATRNALRVMWGLTDSRRPFTYGHAGADLNLEPYIDRRNVALSDIPEIPDDIEIGDAYRENVIDRMEKWHYYKTVQERSWGPTIFKQLKTKMNRGTVTRKINRGFKKPRPWTI